MKPTDSSRTMGATIYHRKREFFVHSLARTTDGVSIFSEPVLRLEQHATDVEIGLAVQQALAQSRINVPHPTEWKGMLAPLFKAAEVNSWRKFAQSATCVEITAVGDKTTLIPTTYSSGSFEHHPDECITLMNQTANVGAAVRQLLQPM